MKEIEIICPHCNQALEITEDCFEEILDCPACGKSFQLPDLPTDTATPAKKIIIKKPQYGHGRGNGSKPCPMCGETILSIAKKCKHCGSMLDDSDNQQRVTVTGKDPFAEYHTPIQGKKKGNLTAIGCLGVLFGLLAMGLSFYGCVQSTQPAAAEGFVYMFVIGAGFLFASFLWARR